MALPAPIQTIFDRIKLYNGSAHNAVSNAFGFARGGNQAGVFISAMRDIADFGAFVADYAKTQADLITEKAARYDAAVAAIEAGPVTSVNGMSGAVVLPDVPKVLPPIVTQPVAGSTPSLTGGALALSVDRLTSLYGEAQKTIRFQISTVSTFASVVYDSGVLTQAAVSASLSNAQATLTGGTTYYIRAIQTDAKDVSSGWSAPISFTFPRLPNAPVMSAPANGATNQGAQNGAITLTASAYSHPAGVAQASRRFELSKDDFATIITVNGTVGQASATIASPKDVLAANTTYKVRPIDVDANGGTATGAATSFTVVAQFRPNLGEPYAGGRYGGEVTRNGVKVAIIVSARSAGQFQSYWDDGVGNADRLVTGGRDDWTMPDEATSDVLMANFRPQTTTVPVFQTGGSEAYPTDFSHWSSTVNSDDTVVTFAFNFGTKSNVSKGANPGVYTRAVRYEV